MKAGLTLMEMAAEITPEGELIPKIKKIGSVLRKCNKLEETA